MEKVKAGRRSNILEVPQFSIDTRNNEPVSMLGENVPIKYVSRKRVLVLSFHDISNRFKSKYRLENQTGWLML